MSFQIQPPSTIEIDSYNHYYANMYESDENITLDYPGGWAWQNYLYNAVYSPFFEFLGLDESTRDPVKLDILISALLGRVDWAISDLSPEEIQSLAGIINSFSPEQLAHLAAQVSYNSTDEITIPSHTPKFEEDTFPASAPTSMERT